jgi:riboflavin synthase
MFTGLIESVGEVLEVKAISTGHRIRVATDLAREIAPGESVAFNGVCLTMILSEPRELHADIGPETARVTTLGSLKRGSLVNLERPLRADGRLGGHFVMGHVDATGNVLDIRPESDFYWLTIGFPSLLAPYLIRKGSVAVDGISLTVAGLGDDRFDVMIIPYTWEHTNLREIRVHDRVNIECDMIGKYVVRAAELGEFGPERRIRTTAH